jgi:hypothetical protein
MPKSIFFPEILNFFKIFFYDNCDFIKDDSAIEIMTKLAYNKNKIYKNKIPYKIYAARNFFKC